MSLFAPAVSCVVVSVKLLVATEVGRSVGVSVELWVTVGKEGSTAMPLCDALGIRLGFLVGRVSTDLCRRLRFLRFCFLRDERGDVGGDDGSGTLTMTTGVMTSVENAAGSSLRSR